MRTLLAIVILAALGWSGYWYVHATAVDRAVTGWLAERRAAGWVAEADDVRVRGFPSRVDTTLTGLDLADPKAGWSWHAEAFQVLSLSYRPNHVIAVLPGEQVLATPLDTFRATAERLRGSVIFKPTPRLELDHMTFEIGDMQIASDSGWTAKIGKAILATRQAADGTPFAHDLAFNAERLALPEALTETLTGRLGGKRVLPAEIGTVGVDATLVFDKPWDRPAVEGENPALEAIRVRDLALTWGTLDLHGSGTLEVDAHGFARGRMDLKARNWRAMVDVAEEAGLDPGVAAAVRGGLGLMASLSGNRDTVSVPLDFKGGVARLGPIVLGPAPLLARRG